MTTIPQIFRNRRIVEDDGTPTLEFIQIIEAIRKEAEAAQAFRVAVGSVTKPTGGATVDSQARTAINAIVDA